MLSILCKRLADRHVVTWEHLGRPALLGGGAGSTLKVLRFLWRREYLVLEDPVVTRLAQMVSVLVVAVVAVSLTLQVIFYVHGGRVSNAA
jgi:hypothetical protein